MKTTVSWEKIPKLILIISIITLFLTLFAFIVDATIITPPDPAPSNATLILHFDEPYNNPNYINSWLINHYSWENDLEGWTTSTSKSDSSDSAVVERSTSWATDGVYSVRLYAFDSAIDTANPTLAAVELNMHTYLHNITFDLNLTRTDFDLTWFRVFIDGVEYYNQSAEGVYAVNLAIDKVVNTIRIEVHAQSVSSGSVIQDAAVEAFIDNLTINHKKAFDSSGSNDGAVVGASWVVGRYGYALNFDGVDDYGEINDDASLHLQNFTIAAWFKLDNWDEVNSRVIFSKKYSNTRASYVFGLRTFDLIIFQVVDADGSTIKGFGSGAGVAHTNANLQPDTWYFLVGVKNGSTMTLYLNGEFLQSTKITDNTIPYSANKAYFGAHYYKRITSNFGGIIDEVRIYNRPLSADEIKSMYEALRLHIKDETSQETISNANVTIFNSNTGISVPTVPIDNVTKDAILFHANMTSYGYGQYFVSVSANNYYERKLIANINDGELTELTSYLPPTSANVVYDVFTLEDPTGSFNSTQTILQIKKPIGGEVVPVFQSYFDFNDQAGTYLILDDYYQLSLITDSQESNFGWLVPDLDGEITIIPSKITIYNYFNEWVAVNNNFNDSTKTITVEYNSTTSISKAKFWVNFSNGTNAYYAEIDNQSTGSFTYTASINDSYLVRLRIEAADGRVYDPFWFVDWSGVQERIPFLTDLPSWAKEIVVVGMLIVFLLIFGNYRADVSTAMTAGMAALAWWLGWLNTNFTVIVIMVVIAVGAVINYQRKEVRD